MADEIESNLQLNVINSDIPGREGTKGTHGEDGCAVPEAGGDVYDWDVSSIGVELDSIQGGSPPSFSGFVSGLHEIPPLLAGRVRSVSEGVESNAPNRMRTRARGPVENLPHVQPWTLERARKICKPK